MAIWTVQFDARRFASPLILDKSGNQVEWFFDWPDFRGARLSSQWKIYSIKIKGNKPVGNFTHIDPGALVCDSYALHKLHDHLEDEVEILPIDVVDGIDMSVLNIINIVDCLDTERSEITYFKNSENVMNIKSYSFNLEPLENVMLFKIPQLSRTDIFATDAFRDIVLGSSLTGLVFGKVD